MREITNLMINEFHLEKLGYDFMGYKFANTRELSFHHLIIPHRHCKNTPDEGYVRENGAILKQSTSHNYLHLIEQYDYEKFLAITSEMIDMNISGEIRKSNLKQIREILCFFEDENFYTRTKKGKLLIKKEYVNSRIDL